MNNEEKQSRKAIEDIFEDDTFVKLIFRSLKSLKPTMKRFVIMSILWLMFYILYANFFVKHIKAIDSTLAIFNSVFIVIIPLFAIIVTSYAVFQALTNGRTLTALMRADEDERSKFQEYNYFFFSIAILYLTIIILSFILSIILNNLPKGWYFPHFTQSGNNQIFSVLISTYIVLILNALAEMKSFMYNLYQLFSSHAVASTIDQLMGDNEK